MHDTAEDSLFFNLSSIYGYPVQLLEALVMPRTMKPATDTLHIQDTTDLDAPFALVILEAYLVVFRSQRTATILLILLKGNHLYIIVGSHTSGNVHFCPWLPDFIFLK